jgi:hypothetical protein
LLQVVDVPNLSLVNDIFNINDAIATVDEAMLERKWMEIEHRLDVLRATNGAHVEFF